mmetsp:Transcript_19184/g.44664  ORF Transcript_19184/g.44664 Transcript_19184/m.44664 type:complete len:114 (+) Transcript_19184:229-570(+)
MCMAGSVFYLVPLGSEPGVPIHLARAALLVAHNQRKCADTKWRDLVIAVVLGMVIKFFAVALQHMLIGYPFSGSFAIKKTIGDQKSVTNSHACLEAFWPGLRQALPRCWVSPH